MFWRVVVFFRISSPPKNAHCANVYGTYLTRMVLRWFSTAWTIQYLQRDLKRWYRITGSVLLIRESASGECTINYCRYVYVVFSCCSRKMCVYDSHKPLIVPAGHDCFDKIDDMNGAGSIRSMDKYKNVFASNFKQVNEQINITISHRINNNAAISTLSYWYRCWFLPIHVNNNKIHFCILVYWNWI